MAVRPRISPSATTALLLAGDVACIALFSAVGVLQHGSGPLPARAPAVAAPFVLGWALVGLFVGAFAHDALRSVRAAAGRAAVGWGGAAVVGQVLRSTSLFPGGFDPVFFLVSLVVTGALLVAWRTGVAVAYRQAR